MEPSMPEDQPAQRPRNAAEGEPRLSSNISDGRLELAASGRWTAAYAQSLETLIDGVVRTASGGRSGTIDMGRISAFDTYGAWLLERLTRAWGDRGGEALSVRGLPERYRGLI